MRGKIEYGGWRFMLTAARWADAPSVFVGRAVSWLFIPLIAIIIVDALSRKFIRKFAIVVENDLHGLFNSPVFQDSEWHLHTIIFLGAIGYAYSRNAHVRLDIFRPRLGVRGRLLVEFMGGIFLLTPFLLVFAHYSWDYFWISWRSDEGSSVATGIGHRWFIKFFLFLGPVLLLLSSIAMLIRLSVRIFGPDELAAEAGTDKIADGSFSAYN